MMIGNRLQTYQAYPTDSFLLYSMKAKFFRRTILTTGPKLANSSSSRSVVSRSPSILRTTRVRSSKDMINRYYRRLEAEEVVGIGNSGKEIRDLSKRSAKEKKRKTSKHEIFFAAKIIVALHRVRDGIQFVGADSVAFACFLCI